MLRTGPTAINSRRVTFRVIENVDRESAQSQHMTVTGRKQQHIDGKYIVFDKRAKHPRKYFFSLVRICDHYPPKVQTSALDIPRRIWWQTDHRYFLANAIYILCQWQLLRQASHLQPR